MANIVIFRSLRALIPLLVSEADLRFFKKITQPNFWAKNCTNKKCVNYDYFYLECINALKSIN